MKLFRTETTVSHCRRSCMTLRASGAADPPAPEEMYHNAPYDRWKRCSTLDRFRRGNHQRVPFSHDVRWPPDAKTVQMVQGLRAEGFGIRWCHGGDLHSSSVNGAGCAMPPATVSASSAIKCPHESATGAPAAIPTRRACASTASPCARACLGRWDQG